MGDGNDDDDIDEARFGYRDEQPQMMQHRLRLSRERESERETGVVVIAVVGRLFGFVWFRFGFLERRSQSLNRCSIVRLNEERMGVALG